MSRGGGGRGGRGGGGERERAALELLGNGITDSEVIGG
jgi:hypothetical protein